MTNGLIRKTRNLPELKSAETGCVKELKRYPVSKLVNQVGNNSKECMEQLKNGGP